MSHIWMSHVTHMNESCHTYEWVATLLSLDSGCFFTFFFWAVSRSSTLTMQVNGTCRTYEWVMSHIWMSHVTHMNESCHTHEWVATPLALHREGVFSFFWAVSQSSILSLQVNGTCRTCNKSCHTDEWVMSHRWMSHVTQMNESCHICEGVMSYLWMSHFTHMNEAYHNGNKARLESRFFCSSNWARLDNTVELRCDRQEKYGRFMSYISTNHAIYMKESVISQIRMNPTPNETCHRVVTWLA